MAIQLKLLWVLQNYKKKFKKMSSNIARGDILRAGIINHSFALLRALLERGYYSKKGLIWGDTVSEIE